MSDKYTEIRRFFEEATRSGRKVKLTIRIENSEGEDYQRTAVFSVIEPRPFEDCALCYFFNRELNIGAPTRIKFRNTLAWEFAEDTD